MALYTSYLLLCHPVDAEDGVVEHVSDAICLDDTSIGQRFTRIDQHDQGPKSLVFAVYSLGGNYVRHEVVEKAMIAAPWENPLSVVLLQQSQDDRIITVFRLPPRKLIEERR